MKHPCFISYANIDPEDPLARLVVALKDMLASYLRQHFKEEVFFDKRIKAGYRFNEEIADSLCRSVCMVIFFMPVYNRSEYCRRELEGMLSLEKERFEKLKKEVNPKRGLIIPVIIGGKPEDMPERLIKHIQFCDLRDWKMTWDPDLNIKYQIANDFGDKLRAVAEFIDEAFQEFGDLDLWGRCEGYTLPRIEKDEKTDTAPAEDLLFRNKEKP